MKFETIIFLVILFNVVTAFLQRRAKAAKAKRASEAAAANSLKPAQPAPKTSRIEIRTVPEPEWGSEAEEDEEHSHTGAWHAEEAGEGHPARPSRQAPRSEPEQRRTPGNTTKEKAATLGKSLLEQLAKELGLRLPESESEPEIPVNPPPRPIPVPEASLVHAERIDARVKTAPAPHQTPVAREAAKIRTPFGLDTQKMREAVILREILDKPVSLRTGRFK